MWMAKAVAALKDEGRPQVRGGVPVAMAEDVVVLAVQILHGRGLPGRARGGGTCRRSPRGSGRTAIIFVREEVSGNSAEFSTPPFPSHPKNLKKLNIIAVESFSSERSPMGADVTDLQALSRGCRRSWVKLVRCWLGAISSQTHLSQSSWARILADPGFLWRPPVPELDESGLQKFVLWSWSWVSCAGHGTPRSITAHDSSHHEDGRSFGTALLAYCRRVVLSCKLPVLGGCIATSSPRTCSRCRPCGNRARRLGRTVAPLVPRRRPMPAMG